MACASSNSTFQFLRSSAARSRALGESASLRDSGSTAAFTGDRRGSSRSTVRLSMPPLALGASSSSYASTRNAISERVSPAAGSMTYGVQRSPLAWSKYDRSAPECSLCVLRSKSVRLAMPSSSPHSEPWKPNRYSMSTALVDPVLVPLLVRAGLDEELHLHLLELAGPEDEVAGGDLVAEGLPDLSDAERRLLPGRTHHVGEADEDALRGLRPQVVQAGLVLDRTEVGL